MLPTLFAKELKIYLGDKMTTTDSSKRINEIKDEIAKLLITTEAEFNAMSDQQKAFTNGKMAGASLGLELATLMVTTITKMLGKK